MVYSHNSYLIKAKLPVWISDELKNVYLNWEKVEQVIWSIHFLELIISNWKWTCENKKV